MTRHLITNQVVSVASDETSATSRCNFMALQRPPAVGYHVVLDGQYFDEFICDGDGWQFSAKSVCVDHFNDTEHHFRIAP